MTIRVLARSLMVFTASTALAAGPAVQAQTAYPRSAQQPSAYSPRDLAGPPPARVTAAALPAPTGQTVRLDLGAGGGTTRMLSLPRGKSAVIELPVDARDVLVSDPKVADVILSTPRRIYILGSGAGQTDAVFFDGAGRQILNLNIRVDQDVSSLTQTLNRLLGGNVRVEALNDHLILSGEVANASEADKALRLAQSAVGAPDRVLNMLSIAGPEQVMLRVRIVEVDRTVVKQLGVNLNAVYNQIGEPQLLFGTASTFGVNGALLGGLTGGLNHDTTTNPTANPVSCNYAVSPAQCVTLPQEIIDRNFKLSGLDRDGPGSPNLNQAEAMLKAFERVGMVRTLAEPNLTAVSGEAAKFLAGGEFPVPVGQDNSGRVTIEFKPFGVGLGFTPVVLSNGRISLKLSTEFSELTNVGSFSLSVGNQGGVTVPGLNVRRTETTVELPSGGGMMISGLMQSVTKQTIDALPGLMQLPVLGALFRSRDFVNNETELVVIVTPYLVRPTNPDKLQTPADGLVIANDMQTVLLGRLNQAFGKTPVKATAYQGPYGYVVD